jgi:small subunit ribosomal protein S16
MVRIRLARLGAKKHPFYRVAVADSRCPRDGRCIEYIGHYNPMVEPPQIKLDLARVDHWINVGAQPSETVGHLISKARAAAAAAPQDGAQA